MAVAEAYIEALFAEAESHGVSRAQLLERLPGDSRTLGNAELAELCRHAIELTGQPALGLLIGRRLNLTSHGMLGFALMSSRNADEVLSLLQRYASLALDGVMLERVLRGDQLQLVCRLTQPVFSRSFVLELVVASLVSASRLLFQRRIPDAEIWFEHPSPAYASECRQILKAPVRFSQPATALVCNRTFLDTPVPSANPALAELSARQCALLARNMRTRSGLSAVVRNRLLASNGPLADQGTMAAELGLGERTFRRRLAAEGVGYRELLEEVRAELARRYLLDTDLPVSEIGALVGYDDAANFRRACRRWFGHPPSALREQDAAINDPQFGHK